MSLFGTIGTAVETEATTMFSALAKAEGWTNESKLQLLESLLEGALTIAGTAATGPVGWILTAAKEIISSVNTAQATAATAQAAASTISTPAS